MQKAPLKHLSKFVEFDKIIENKGVYVMPFQVISMKNKSFWSRVITAIAGFTMVIIAVAVVFPIGETETTTQVQTQTQTTTTVEEQ